MTKTQRALMGAALILPLAWAGLAQAQAYSPPSGSPYDQSGDGSGQPAPPSPADAAAHLRQQLQLRPDQDVALNAFVQAVTPPAGLEARLRREQEQARTLTTPQRLDLVVSNMDEIRSFTLARVQATKAFYNQLNPDQQRAFDHLGAQGGDGGPGASYPGANHPEPQSGPNSPQDGG